MRYKSSNLLLLLLLLLLTMPNNKLLLLLHHHYLLIPQFALFLSVSAANRNSMGPTLTALQQPQVPNQGNADPLRGIGE